MTREEAKEMFRKNRDLYGRPCHIMKNIDRIYNDFEKEKIAGNIDAEFIKSILPEWAKETPPEGLDPTFYGTGSQAGDQEIVNRVNKILKPE